MKIVRIEPVKYLEITIEVENVNYGYRRYAPFDWRSHENGNWDKAYNCELLENLYSEFTNRPW